MSAERFGQLLRQYRVAAGFSQEHVAEEARLSVVSISALERGLRQAPYRHTVQRIVKALALDEAQATELEAAADAARRRPRAGSGAPKASGNLPAGTFPLVGRAADVTNVARLMEPNHLVTITGTGGVGKTRVAMDVAAELQHVLGPPAFVDLGTNESVSIVPAAIASAIASAIAERVVAEHYDAQALARWLGNRRLLIVLDTCEHALDDVASIAAAILRSCPRITLLATSRERIGVSGEVVYRLSPLSVPAVPVADLMDAHSYSALDLFIRRAASGALAASFTNAGAETIASICRELDGIPLLIELAAAKVGALGLQTLAVRLREGLEPITVNRGAPPRHQTPFASIAWSYQLLTSLEQEVLTQLSVFPGIFTLEDVEAACTAHGLDNTSISDVLSSLVGKNLIEVEAAGAATRHRMLKTIRRFASIQHTKPT